MPVNFFFVVLSYFGVQPLSSPLCCCFFFARSYVALGFSINTTFLRAFFLISSYLSSSHSDLLYSFVFFLHIMLSVYFMHSFLLPPPLLLLYVSSKLYEFISIVRFSIIRRRVVLFSSGYAKY